MLGKKPSTMEFLRKNGLQWMYPRALMKKILKLLNLRRCSMKIEKNIFKNMKQIQLRLMRYLHNSTRN